MRLALRARKPATPIYPLPRHVIASLSREIPQPLERRWRDIFCSAPPRSPGRQVITTSYSTPAIPTPTQHTIQPQDSMMILSLEATEAMGAGAVFRWGQALDLAGADMEAASASVVASDFPMIPTWIS